MDQKNADDYNEGTDEMKTIAATLIALAACGADGPDASTDPRTVPCATFENDGYRQKLPQSACYFDLTDLEWASFPVRPGETERPIIKGWYCGPNCSGGSTATFVGPGDQWKGGTITWTGDTELGVAVMVGDIRANTCAWTRCTRVE